MNSYTGITICYTISTNQWQSLDQALNPGRVCQNQCWYLRLRPQQLRSESDPQPQLILLQEDQISLSVCVWVFPDFVGSLQYCSSFQLWLQGSYSHQQDTMDVLWRGREEQRLKLPLQMHPVPSGRLTWGKYVTWKAGKTSMYFWMHIFIWSRLLFLWCPVNPWGMQLRSGIFRKGI